ncbi:endonuclease SmrB [Aliiglaciecola sp. 3_MG-2023]|uniref:endonuclease SmrB n=1 Tax=Aliiglaciecola sp. 3_MG-2023 TaxID=3062644 RepID=UPI0026E2C517|nr:endonuclease SmrB [Aliiglaciecola sp. 3_MG-2023]MDO6695343.1 endonuclease SmrB [Aliiglaciecola sp. 3_MG-2023]
MKKQPNNPFKRLSIAPVNPPEPDDHSLFRGEFKDVAQIKQDKITPPRPSSKKISHLQHKKQQENLETKQAAASFHFSDGFEAYFSEQGPLKYIKPGKPSYEVKRLRRGEYPPDLILDLHGLTKENAKLEIAALIVAAKKQNAHCVCIVHGLGSLVLKNAVPNWLVQHPDVEGFHQAPLEWGGKGALLVLIEQPESFTDFF